MSALGHGRSRSFSPMILANSYQQIHPQRPLILLLQGPVGPFFRELQRSLVDRGFDVVKVNFNGGDLLFSTRDEAMNFRGSPAQWTAWLHHFAGEHGLAAIALFGDSRPYHAEAVQVAQARKIPVWSLEEGYVRPQYVTCERSGNNANSPLRQDSAVTERQAAGESRPVKNPLGAMARYAIFHAIAQRVLAAPFRGNVRHRQRPLVREAVRWGLSLIRKAAFYPANSAIFRRITTQKLRNYYVVALQVHDDLNLLRNGNGWTMGRLIDEVTRSFARHAPLTHQLLFKVHPLDRGHLPYRRLVARAARQNACQSRVRIVDDRPIGPMIRHSDGVITVNSTSGLIALEHGKPLMALGNAVYSTAALKTLPPRRLEELDRFWTQPVIAPVENVQPFFERMFEQSLVGGNFYLAAERRATADAVAGRIHEEFVSMCLRNLLPARGDLTDGIGHERLVG